MIAQIRQLIKDCLTGKDGETYDPARVATMFALATFFGLAIYTVAWKGTPFDMQQFGIGFGAIIAGGSWGIRMKASTEPGQ